MRGKWHFEFMALQINHNKHLYWIDWMKTIGITLIVFGHFASPHNVYAYVFSVPLFFLISGFLSKREENHTVFWKKIWHNLIVPMLIICTINYLYVCARHYISPIEGFFPDTPPIFIAKLLLGVHKSVETLWFVYTLVILKIILQYLPKPWQHCVLFAVCLATAYCINEYQLSLFGKPLYYTPCAITSVFVSYPFYMIGYWLRDFRETFNNYRVHSVSSCIALLVCALLVFICGYKHTSVFLFLCGYGDSIILFLLGGMAGSACVYIISKFLVRVKYAKVQNFNSVVSQGTILILGFHMPLVRFLRRFEITSDIQAAAFSILIVLLFVPIIMLCKKYAPIIMGKYRAK